MDFDRQNTVSWSGLPTLGEGRGSRPSTYLEAAAFTQRWFLGTSPRMTTFGMFGVLPT